MIRRSSFVCRPVWIASTTFALVPALLAQTSPQTPDLPPKYEAPAASYDYIKRDVMIPMRDGVKLHTVIVIPRGAKNAPIILTRTPTMPRDEPSGTSLLTCWRCCHQGDEGFVAEGYIQAFPGCAWKYGSEGDYFMTRPLRGPLNSSDTDESTDAYDTMMAGKECPRIQRESGDAGKLLRGLHRRDGFGHPHPALKVAAPMSPWLTVGWATTGFTSERSGKSIWTTSRARLRQGEPARALCARVTMTTTISCGRVRWVASPRPVGWTNYPGGTRWRSTRPTTRSGVTRPLDKTMGAQPLKVPRCGSRVYGTQEDMWGAIHCYLGSSQRMLATT